MARGMCAIVEEILDHGLTDTDIMAELVQELIAHAFESVDCARSGTLPAQLARGLAGMAANLEDRKAAMQ
jgi:hypothetical protein